MAFWQSQPMSDHASQSVSSLSTQASSYEVVRSTRIYQIMLVAHELVLEGKSALSLQRKSSDIARLSKELIELATIPRHQCCLRWLHKRHVKLAMLHALMQ